MPDPKLLAALRTLMSASKLPEWRHGGGVATGVRAIDELVGGGLEPGRLTELVSAPGTGGQLVLGELLAATRASRQRVALVDACDGFAPDAHEPDNLRHLVWARARGLREALITADILIRDGNYAVIVIDLRGVPAADLNHTPKSTWHRLHRVAERQPVAVLVQTSCASVPAVRWRLSLTRLLPLAFHRFRRGALVDEISVSVTRGAHEELRTA